VLRRGMVARLSVLVACALAAIVAHMVTTPPSDNVRAQFAGLLVAFLAGNIAGWFGGSGAAKCPPQ
jgi:hypothetical protein